MSLYGYVAKTKKALWAQHKPQAAKQRKPLTRKRVNPISAKMKELKRQYRKQRAAFLAANPRCAVFPQEAATEVHHKFGRNGSLLLDERHWMAVSRAAHNLIHQSPAWAQEQGYLAPKGQWNKPDRTI